MKSVGYEMDDVFQGTNLTPVIREVEGIIKDKKIHFGDNDLRLPRHREMRAFVSCMA